MGVQIPMGRGNFGEKGRPLQSSPIGTFCREQCKTAESIDLPFGLWTPVDRSKHKLNGIRQVALREGKLAPAGECD